MSKSGNGWVKQGLLVETDGQYPKKALLTLFGDKMIGDAERYSVGDNLLFHLNIEAREWNGKWYNDVSCWKIEMSGNSGRSAPAQAQSKQAPAKSQPAPAASQPVAAAPLPFAADAGKWMICLFDHLIKSRSYSGYGHLSNGLRTTQNSRRPSY